METQTTFIMIKPGAVQKNLIGEIISKIEKKGLKICAIKLVNVTNEMAQNHYSQHKEKPFFQELVNSLMISPVVCLLVSGSKAITIVRKMAGSTDPVESQPGTIRGDYSCDIQNNIIHTSDSEQAAKEKWIFILLKMIL
jgi:nucleoside-diphosphate kinase